jgi:phage terminase large subunit GpA-like protein
MIWLDEVWREAIAPEATLTVSQWADTHRALPATSAEPGPWRTDRTPYLREIMDALSTGSPYERVVLQKGAQLGATECAINWLAYIVCHAPGIALLVTALRAGWCGLADRSRRSVVDRRVRPAAARAEGGRLTRW